MGVLYLIHIVDQMLILRRAWPIGGHVLELRCNCSERPQRGQLGVSILRRRILVEGLEHCCDSVVLHLSEILLAFLQLAKAEQYGFQICS